MATPYQFRYFLLNKSGQYYYLNGSNIELTDTPTTLPESPKGWDKVTKSFTRGLNSFGIFSKTTTPIEFHGVAKQILDSIYYIQGGVDFEAYCLLRIDRRVDEYPNIWDYELDFEGELDFSTWNEGGSDDNVYVTLSVSEKGIEELLDSNSDIEYEIPFDGTARNINHDGIDLKTEYKFTIKEQTRLDNIWDNTYAPFVPITFDGIYPVIKTFPVGEIDLLTSNPMDNKLFVPEIDITGGQLVLQGGVEYYNGFTSGVDIQLFYKVLIFRNQDYNTAAVEETIYIDPTPLSSGNSASLNINATLDIDFLQGDYVVIVYGIEATGTGGGSFDIVTSILDLYLRGNYRLGTSLVPSYDIYQFVEKMVAKVTEGAATLQSTFLSTMTAIGDDLTYKLWSLIPRRLRVSSGEGIRYTTGVIKYTWDDCRQLLQSVFGIMGIGVSGNKVIIEPLNYFFSRTEMIDIGEVKDLKISTATDFVYNSIKAGFPDKDYEDINGRDMVHSEVNYSLGIKRVKKELNLIAPAVVDPYTIEQLRSFQFKPTTDNSNDNELVLLYCEEPPSAPSDNITLQRYSSTQNGGVYSPTTFYNQVLYPVLNTYRALPYLKSIKNSIPNASQGNMKAIFESGLKNTEAWVKINTPYTIAQNDDVYINNISQPPINPKAFVPVNYEFEQQPVNNLSKTIENDPYKYITFTSQGTRYAGYVLNVDIVNSEMDIYTFKLLGAPINEL